MRLGEWWRTEGRDLLEVVVSALVLALLVTTFIAQPFLVEGSSMEPTLHSGQRLLVSKLEYRFGQPKQADVVVFRYPSDRRLRYIKRVIGVGGDTVAIRAGDVWVNGKAIREPYLIQNTWGDFGPTKVPAGRLFVLGDNRGNSKDSRFSDVGFVPENLVVGRAVAVYWPLGELGVIKSQVRTR